MEGVLKENRMMKVRVNITQSTWQKNLSGEPMKGMIPAVAETSHVFDLFIYFSGVPKTRFSFTNAKNEVAFFFCSVSYGFAL